jgi:hypothetical protein
VDKLWTACGKYGETANGRLRDKRNRRLQMSVLIADFADQKRCITT